MTTPPDPTQPQQWTVDRLIHQAGNLCEGPVWDDRSQRLLWTDIYACVVSEATADGQVVARHQTPSPVGSFAPRSGQGYVVATEAGLALVDQQWQHWQPVGSQRGLPSPVRSNDGACDPRGRFFAGTMSHDDLIGAGCVYRLDPPVDRTASEPVVVLVGTTISNGIDWSPDGHTMYFVDSATQRVDAFDYDVDTGNPSARRTFVELPSNEGCPDGLTVDAEGCVWVALWDGGQVRRYNPDGRLVGIVEVPAPRVTSCTFGGPDLRTLFITTAKVGLDEPALAAFPDSGSIFACRPGVTGHPVARYDG
jgi:sugar lactone lactonase YvrE